MTYTIQLRRDNAADWTSVNPILHEGEPGVELDTGKYKIGDGSTAWVDLDYAIDVVVGPPGADGAAGPPGADGAAGAAGAAGAQGPAGKVILAGHIVGVLVAGAGGSRIYNDTGGNLNIANVRASLVTPPSGGPATFDVNLNGTTIFTTQANRPSIAAAANASSAAVPDVTVWPNGQYITVDVDLIGTTYAGANATFQIGLA